MNFISSLCWVCLSATAFLIGGSWASYMTASNLADLRAQEQEGAYTPQPVAEFSHIKELDSGYQKDETARKPPLIARRHS